MTTAAAASIAPRPVRRWLLPAAVFVGASALAAVLSPSISLWTDEAVTISAAERSLGDLWALVQRIDAVHALYYAFMSVWVDAFGASPFSLRLPSALAAGGTALGVYLLTRMLATPRTALVAALVCATLPRLTWAGIEARPFVFSALIAVWSTVLLLRALRRRSAPSWLVYGILALLGVVVNIYLALLVVAHGVTVLLRARRERRTVIAFLSTAVATAVVAAPLLLLVRSQQAQLGTDGDRSLLSIARKILVNQLFLGETPDPDAADPWLTRAWQVSAIAATVLGLTAIVLAIVRRPAAGDRKGEMLALTLPWLVLPTAVVALYAVAASPIYQPRYFTFTAPAGAVLIALGVRGLTRRWYVATGVVVYFFCVAIVFASQRTPFAKSGSDWSAVASLVGRESAEGDAVYFAPRYPDRSIIDQTTRRIAQSYPDDFTRLDDLTLDRTGAATATLDGFSLPIDDVRPRLEEHDRVWALFNRKALPDARDASERLFSALGFTSSVRWDGPSTVVVEYVRTR